MSASTEKLLEQITLLEQAIETAETTGQDTSKLKSELVTYQRKLDSCNHALHENKQILKG